MDVADLLPGPGSAACRWLNSSEDDDGDAEREIVAQALHAASAATTQTQTQPQWQRSSCVNARVDDDLVSAYSRTVALLRESRECPRCAQTFRERANIGQWLCKTHPGVRYQDAHKVFRFTCCPSWTAAEAEARLGCTPCDHAAYVVDDSQSQQLLRVPHFLLTRMTLTPKRAAIDFAREHGFACADIRHPEDAGDAESETLYARYLKHHSTLISRIGPRGSLVDIKRN